jgi:hypothetical protein
MAKDDKPEFEGFFKGMDAQVRDYREKREREVAAAWERLEDPTLAAAQQAAYEATLPEMLELPASEVRCPVSDPRLILDEALNYAEAVGARQRELRARAPGRYRVELMLASGRYALATMHAFKAHRDKPVPPDSLPMLVKEGAERRFRLAIACDLAFSRHREWYEQLKDIEGSTVPEAIAYDIFRLRRTLLQSDPKTGGPWYANHEELAHAEQLANTLLQAATNPSLRDALAWPTADLYARAYTLVHRACYEAQVGLDDLDGVGNPEGPFTTICLFCDWQASTLLSVHDLYRGRHL